MLLLQAADGSVKAPASAAPSASAAPAPATSAVAAPEPGPKKGLAGGTLPAPAWLVVLLAAIAVTLGVGFFVLRHWLRKSNRKDDSVAPMSSRR